MTVPPNASKLILLHKGWFGLTSLSRHFPMMPEFKSGMNHECVQLTDFIIDVNKRTWHRVAYNSISSKCYISEKRTCTITTCCPRHSVQLIDQG